MQLLNTNCIPKYCFIFGNIYILRIEQIKSDPQESLILKWKFDFGLVLILPLRLEYYVLLLIEFLMLHFAFIMYKF